jgi:transposase
MAQELVSDELWGLIEPLLPPPLPRPKGGRPPKSNRAVLRGIVFVLQSGIPWEMLPPEMGCGCGMTCWRRLQAWQQVGVWQKLHHVLLNRLGQADQIDWSRAAIDAASVAAPGGAKRPGRIQRIAANRARSAMCWSMPRASRWR